MSAMRVALWLAAALVGIAVVPTLWVFGREARNRWRTKRALGRLENARKLIGDAAGTDVGVLAAKLRATADALTVERVVNELLRDADEGRRELGVRLFAELKLVEHYGKVLREARRWSERAHAAEVLGLAGLSEAVPALVASLNDRFEDEASVKSTATTALAKLQDPSAIPLLVKELLAIDERSARSVAEALAAFGTLAVPPLLDVLGKPNEPAARAWAARILGRAGDKRATDDLVARLNDRDDLLRAAAAEALGLIADVRAVQPLVRATLRDPAPQVRAHAAGSLARIQGERAVDVLVAALADPDYATRLRALEAFEIIKLADTAPLESALRDPNAEVRRRAALALERVGYVERVVGELTHEAPEAASRAYAALLELGRAGILDTVASFIHHESFQVRALVARACGELGVPRVGPLLVARLDDPEWPVRAMVAEALGRLKPDGTSGALVPLLNDSEEVVREAVAEALTNFPEKELGAHIAELATAYDRGSAVTRRHIVIIVTRLTGDLVDSFLARASADPSEAVRLHATTALAGRAPEVTVGPLLARLDDPVISVRVAAVVALGSSASTEAFEGLLRALAGAPPDVREHIAEALSQGARPQLMARLDELENNPSLDVRLGIAWTLGKCGESAGVPTLGRFLRDRDARLRASAAGALVKIGDKEALELLLGAVDDPNGQVRAAVVNALGRAPKGDERVISTLSVRTRDPDPFVRNRALVSLACVAGEAVEDRFEELARDIDRPARLTALALLGTESSLGAVLDVLTAPSTLESIMSFLAHEHPSVRARFLAAVHLDDARDGGKLPDDVEGFVARYEGLLRASLDVEERQFAVDALARIMNARTVAVLADALTSDPTEKVRLRAARALATRARDAVARKGLCRAIADPSSDVAHTAVLALRGDKAPEVARALERRLGAGTSQVQEAVEATLADLHREDPFPFFDWMMGGEDPELTIPGLRVVRAMANPEAFPLLRALGQSPVSTVRAAAVRALAALPIADVGPTLDEMVDDPSEDVRLAVLDTISWNDDGLLRATALRRDPSVPVRTRLAVSLARFDGKTTRAALKLLESLTEDGAAVVRAAALVSLMASEGHEGVSMFTRLWPGVTLDTRFALKEEARAVEVSELLAARLRATSDPAARRAAVFALGALGAPGLFTRILPALRDPSPDVRIAAIQAVAPLDTSEVRARLAEMLADPDLAVRDVARRSMIRAV